MQKASLKSSDVEIEVPQPRKLTAADVEMDVPSPVVAPTPSSTTPFVMPKPMQAPQSGFSIPSPMRPIAEGATSLPKPMGEPFAETGKMIPVPSVKVEKPASVPSLSSAQVEHTDEPYVQRWERPELPGEYTQAATDKYSPGNLDEHLERFTQAAAAAGLKFKLREVDRDTSRQARLYAQGRTAPGPIVTNAAPGLSLHERHRAFDVEMEDPSQYAKLGELARSMGIIWGGDFVNLQGDLGHFELPSKVRPPTYRPSPPVPEDLK